MTRPSRGRAASSSSPRKAKKEPPAGPPIPALVFGHLRRDLIDARNNGRNRQPAPERRALRRQWERGRQELAEQMRAAEALREVDGAAWLRTPDDMELVLRLDGADRAVMTVWGDPEKDGWVSIYLLDDAGYAVRGDGSGSVHGSLAGAARWLAAHFGRVLPRLPLAEWGRR